MARRALRFQRPFAMALALVLVLTAGSALVASGNTQGTTFYGCLASSGQIYAVSVTGTVGCKKGDRQIQWNEQGPQGIPGSDGAPGSDGGIGPQGTPGATGATGSVGATGPQGTPGSSGVAGLGWVSASRTYDMGDSARMTVEASCTGEKVALAGGFEKSAFNTWILSSMPILNEGVATGWRVIGHMSELFYGEWTVTAYALCGNAS